MTAVIRFLGYVVPAALLGYCLDTDLILEISDGILDIAGELVISM